VGVRREGVALTPGKSQGGRSKERKTGSKDRYKRKREEGAKGKESMDHEGNRGVENSEGSRSGAEINSQQSPSNSTQNKKNTKQKQSASTPSPNPPSRMIRILTVNIDGHSKAKWTYLCNLSCFKNLDIIIMTEHHLSSTFCPVKIVESGWSIQQVPGAQKRWSRQHEYGGGVAILTRDEAGLHVEQTRVIDGSLASPHQAVSWKISSDNHAQPFHITGMYMSPSEGMVEEFFQTLAKQNNLPPNEPNVYAGDNTSHVGEEIEAHLSSQEMSKLPERVGDDKHPLEPPQMPFLDSDRPSSKQRGRVFLKMPEKTHHIILNSRFELNNSPTPYTWQQNEKASIIDYNTISKEHFHLVKSCTVIPRSSRKSRSTPKPPTDHNLILLHVAMPTVDDSKEAQQEYIQRQPRTQYHSARLKYNNVLQKLKTIMEGKSEEGAERLKALKSDLTQGKIDADQYADSANTILVSIIQHAARTTLGQIDSRDRLARDDGPDRQPDSEEALKTTKYSSNDSEIKNAQSRL